MSILDLDIVLLAAVRPLALMEREALRLIAFSSDRKHMRAGETLYRKDDPSTGAAVVIEGAIAFEGHDSGEISKLAERGALIGEFALLAPTKHAANAIARRPSELLLISRPLFKRVLEEFPQSALAMRQAYARDLANFNAQTERVRRRIDAIG